MVSSSKLMQLYGDPSVNTPAWERTNMEVMQVPDAIRKAIPALPSRIYCHRKFKGPLLEWLKALIQAGVHTEIMTYDGCWNVRKKRGLSSLSIHAFGMAVDINASHNPLGVTASQAAARGLRPFSANFIRASRPYMDCGADWRTRPDGMHFQIKAEDAYK